jgi:deoxycytidine triphosphate deaminase
MVLLDDKIKEKIKNDLLIINPDLENEPATEEEREKNLESLKNQVSHASYNIRVGKKAVIEAGEETKELTDYEEIILKPFEVAIIETYEIINIPNNLIARWNIRVKLAYEGLIWVGGPQVDPGYKGHLYCPIYNMSDKNVTLKYKDGIATMDFVQTTEPTENSTSFNKEIMPFEAYKNKKLKSALTTHVQKRLESFEEKQQQTKKEVNEFKEKMEERLHKLQTTFLTVIGALFATLSILIISIKGNDTNICSYSSYVAIGLAISALILHNKDSAPIFKKALNLFGYVFIVFIFMVFGLVLFEIFSG